MKSTDRFSIVRTILKSMGLSADAVDDIIDRIIEFLSGGNGPSADELEYPYCLRDDFLSPAEHSFFMVLRSAVSDKVLVQTKVNLGDLFYARSSDPSKYRIYTNKIDRKHVDFLLCDPKTVRPLVAIELDDKSHQRDDRQARDAFVENVFRAAALPLVRVPARKTYSVTELTGLLQPYLTNLAASMPASTASQRLTGPTCPKCGGAMVLRTAKSGENAGQKFWGCSNFPKCRGVMPYHGES